MAREAGFYVRATSALCPPTKTRDAEAILGVCLLLLVTLLLLLSPSTQAQQINATVSGQVADTNESVIPNA
ncbi:MAG: hypothetical protein ACRD6N_09820, partial [Pyrinomonadaceae bacterium]